MVSSSYGDNDARAASVKATLLRMARPEMYRLNDFRVLNLPTRATERDIQKHLRRMQLEQKFGGAAGAGAAAVAAPSPLPLDPPPDAVMIAEAHSHLADAERRLISELFWLWPGGRAQGARDEHAGARPPHDDGVRPPAHGSDLEAAVSFWGGQLERGGEWQGVAAHNLAVLFHAAALDIECEAAGERPASEEPPDSEERKLRLARYWSGAVEMWKRVLAEEHAWAYLQARVEELNDPRLKAATVRRLRLSLPAALLTINAHLAVRASQRGATADARRQAELMSAFDFPADQTAEARRHVLEPLRHRIHDLCVTMGEDARKAPEQAMQVAERLLERARPLLMAVDDLLPAGDPQRPDVLDAVALAANDAAVIRSESLSHGVKRDWKSAQDFFERVSRYAATESMREHINKSLVWVRDNLRYSDHKSCWFCGEREEESGVSATIRMYKMVAANHYNYYDVQVPRCRKCRRAHLLTSALTALGVIAGLAAAVAIYLTLWLPYGPEVKGGGMFWGGLLGAAALSAAGGILAYRLALRTRLGAVKPSRHKWGFPVVLELRSQQWTHIKPS
ncbi:MAG TPA: hypothetical protein VF668_02685 [Pyrinomonadaceae bacterium]|jgi:hypothetical protein